MKSNLLLSIVFVFSLLAAQTMRAQSGQVCSDAIPLVCNGDVIIGSTLGVPSDNATSGYDVCGSIPSSNGQIWYTLYAENSDQITISTCDVNSNFDTYLQVYTGECGAFNCVTYNDDACSLKSTVIFYAIAGETYHIRVGGFGSGSGTYGLVVSCQPVTGGCTNPNADNYNPDATYDDGSCVYTGCMDPTAINFDYYATEDDGSCEYCNGPGSVNALIYVCAFANASELALDIVDSQGNVVITVSGLNNNAIFNGQVCLVPGECYTAIMTNTAGNTGWYNGYFWINVNGVQIINEELNDNLSSESVIFSMDGTCTTIPGCTDPAANNYNPQANTDDGSCVYPVTCEDGTTLTTIYCTPGSFASEVSFNIMDANNNVVYAGGPLLYNQALSAEVCLPDGCYSVYMYDSFGDGWNGAVLTITAAGAVNTYTLGYNTSIGSGAFGINADGCVADFEGGCTDPNAENYDPEAFFNDNTCIYAGCTDPAALNFNWSATIDDGSCEYCDGPGSVSATLYICTFGNGNQVELQINDDQGNEVILIAGLGNGQIFTTDVCLQPGVCYTAYMSNNMGPYGWSGGYFWINAGGVQIINAQPGPTDQVATVLFSIDGTCGQVYGCTDPTAVNYNPDATSDDGTCYYTIYGCTDQTALNFNPQATEDDGSCYYVEDCDQNLVAFYLNGGLFAEEITYDVIDENGNIVANGFYNGYSYACIPDGCYLINMYDSFGDGWDGGGYIEVNVNGNVVATFTLQFGLSYGTAILGVNSNDCIEVIEGCTDPAALNYNPYATLEDGSCVYQEGCEDNFVTIQISTQLWGSEVSWSLVNGDGIEVAAGSGYSSWNNYYEYLCLPAGCYTMNMNDSWGDGWNGAYYLITGNGTFAEGSLFYGDNASDLIGVNSVCGDVDGCTDPAALNYNPAATIDDGSCIYNDNNGNDDFIGLDIDFTIYPNPANTGMVVDITNLSKTDAVQISVLSVDGKLVMGETVMNNSEYRRHAMDVSSLEAGYYLLMVRNGDAQKVLSFVKE